MRPRKAVVLLSGGLDSSTALYVARHVGHDVYGLIFDYGQRHKREVQAAQKVARLARCPFRVVKIDLPWKGSALLDQKMRIARVSRPGRIPPTYVPARNTIFLSFALSFAEAIGARHIFIGANAVDYSGYPDCRPAYYGVFNQLSALATKCGVHGDRIRIETPLIAMTKAQIIKLGLRLGVPYQETWSCYRGKGRPCGTCDSCRLRAKGFREAGIKDPSV